MSAIALGGPGLGASSLSPAEASRWGASFLVVLGLHAAALMAVVAYRSVSIEPGEALPAVMIDMAPPPSAPAVAPADAPPQEEVPETAMPEPVLNAPPDVPEPDVQPPEPIVTAEVPPLEPLPAVQPVETVPTPPPPVVRETATVALPPPPPKVAPPPVKKAEKKPEVKKPPKPVQARKAEERQEARRPPQTQTGAQTTASVTSTSSGSSAAARSSWQGSIVAALNRAKRPQAESGMASVRFSIDRGGRVLNASLAGSTGVANLDQEAVSLVRRASIPAAPSDVAGSSFTFTVPIRFTSR